MPSRTLVLDGAGGVVSVFAVDIADGQVQVIRSVINPGKLRHLGQRADIASRAARQAAHSTGRELTRWASRRFLNARIERHRVPSALSPYGGR